MQAERDLAKLEAQREAALSDPSRFIAALMTRTNEPLPKRQKVVRIPIVPLERYGIKPEEIGIEPSAPPATTGQPTPFRATPYVEEAIKVRRPGGERCMSISYTFFQIVQAIQPPQSPDGRTLWMPKGLGTFDRLAGTAFRNSLPPRADSPALSDSPVSVVPKHPIAPILEPAPVGTKWKFTDLKPD